MLDKTIQSVHECDADIEILENFTFLAAVVVQNNGRSRQEVLRLTGLARGIIDSFNI